MLPFPQEKVQAAMVPLTRAGFHYFLLNHGDGPPYTPVLALAGGVDEELVGGWEEVLVAWMKSWWVGGGAFGVYEELGGGRRC